MPGERIGQWETAFPVTTERGIQHKSLFYRSVRLTTGWIRWRSSSPVERGPVPPAGNFVPSVHVATMATIHPGRSILAIVANLSTEGLSPVAALWRPAARRDYTVGP